MKIIKHLFLFQESENRDHKIADEAITTCTKHFQCESKNRERQLVGFLYHLIPGFLLFLGLFLVFLLPPADPDLGWHLRCGQLFWSGEGFCSQNWFSVLAPDYLWTNHHWLYQAIIFPLYTVAGLWGLTFFNALLGGLTFLLFYLTGKNFGLEKTLAIILSILSSWLVLSLGLRSQLMGILFFVLLLFLLSKIEKRPKILFWLPIVTILWANFHGGSVMLGLGLICGFYFNTFLNFYLTRQNRSLFLKFTLILFMTFVGTLINPFGMKIYSEAWRHFAVSGLSQLIAEWTPPPEIIFFVILFSGLCLTVFLLITSRREQKILALLLLPYAFLAIKSRRYLPFYFLTAFFLFFQSEGVKKLFSSWLKNEKLRAILNIIILLMLLFYGIFWTLPKTIRQNRSWQDFCENSLLNYPCQAVAYLKNQPDDGIIFNRYEWGGFLIWQLPQHKVFVDGRMPAWPTPEGKSPYTIFLETLQTQPGWEQTLSKYNINWIVGNPGTFLDLLLQPDPGKYGWKEVYRDKVSVIYQKIPST